MDRGPRPAPRGDSPRVAADVPDLRSGFDVKLPVAVTLTGEDRLLYPLNRANATAFSSLASILLRASRESTLDFQCDVASIAHSEPFIGTHLAVIVRAPVRAAPRRFGPGAEPLVRAAAGAHAIGPPSSGARVRVLPRLLPCAHARRGRLLCTVGHGVRAAPAERVRRTA